MLESCVAISKLFDKLKDKLETEITLKTHAIWRIPKINENSTIGQQIKYYRRLANIKQTDLCLKLGCDRGVLDHLENRELKLVNVKLIKDIIKELDIEDKIVMNDDYIAFLLDNPIQTILDFRKKNNLKRIDLAKMLENEDKLSLDVALRIAKRFNISLDYLFNITDFMNEDDILIDKAFKMVFNPTIIRDEYELENIGKFWLELMVLSVNEYLIKFLFESNKLENAFLNNELTEFDYNFKMEELKDKYYKLNNTDNEL